jgi:hypothetical protein
MHPYWPTSQWNHILTTNSDHQTLGIPVIEICSFFIQLHLSVDFATVLQQILLVSDYLTVADLHIGDKINCFAFDLALQCCPVRHQWIIWFMLLGHKQMQALALFNMSIMRHQEIVKVLMLEKEHFQMWMAWLAMGDYLYLLNCNYSVDRKHYQTVLMLFSLLAIKMTCCHLVYWNGNVEIMPSIGTYNSCTA